MIHNTIIYKFKRRSPLAASLIKVQSEQSVWHGTDDLLYIGTSLKGERLKKSCFLPLETLASNNQPALRPKFAQSAASPPEKPLPMALNFHSLPFL